MEFDIPVLPQFQFLASALLEIAQARSLAEMLGYEPQGMAGRRYREFVFEDDPADHQLRVAAHGRLP